MRWFKHFSDNHRGITINRLLDEMGHQGLAYYIIMEICAEKLTKENDAELSGSDCVFTFNRVYFQNILRMKRKSTGLLLGLLSESNLLSYSENDKEVIIKMPILLDLLDYDSKKSRQRRVTIAPMSRLYSESESESEVVVVKETITKINDGLNATANYNSRFDKDNGEWLDLLDKHDLELDLKRSLPKIKAHYITIQVFDEALKRLEESDGCIKILKKYADDPKRATHESGRLMTYIIKKEIGAL